ncbi:hypothetical protein Tco_0236796 [Tanacetum coccineum]
MYGVLCYLEACKKGSNHHTSSLLKLEKLFDIDQSLRVEDEFVGVSAVSHVVVDAVKYEELEVLEQPEQFL